MVFRKDNKVEAFQRQISALRQQLGTSSEEATDAPAGPGYQESEAAPYGGDQAPDGTQLAGGYGTRDASGFSFGGFGASAATNQPVPVDNGTQPASDSSLMPIPDLRPVDAQTSVIAHDTVWKGDLQTEGTIHLHGRFEGSIRAAQDVYVAEEADVDATITATNVIIAGLIKGTIRCTSRFEALPQGRIAGDIQAPTLVIHEGAHVTGQFRMGSAPVEAAEAKTPAPPVVQRRAARGGA